MHTFRFALISFLVILGHSSCSTIRYRQLLKDKVSIGKNNENLFSRTGNEDVDSEIINDGGFNLISARYYIIQPEQGVEIQIQNTINKESYNKNYFAKGDSCDEIVLTNGLIVRAKVSESKSDSIKYYKCNDLSDSLFTINKTYVVGIRYADGSIEQFNNLVQKDDVHIGNAIDSKPNTSIDDREVNKFGVWSFILSLLGGIIFLIGAASIVGGGGLLIGIILCLMGLISGIIGLFKVTRNRIKYKGVGFAIAGIILALAVIVPVLIFIIAFI